jgi:anti-sigma factor RsiW
VTSEAMPHDTGEHPEVAELSDLTEGLLSVSRSEEVRAHLTECPLCTDVHASLAELRGALGSLPSPPRMPDDVAGRIEAALAAEALLDTERRSPEPVPTPVSRETAPDEPVDVSRETRRAHRPSPHPASPGRRTPGGSPGRGRRVARQRRALLTAAGAVGALVLGGALLQGITGGTSAGSDAGAAADGQGDVRSKEDAVAAGGLEQRVRELLSRSASGAEGGPDLKAETKEPSNAPLAGGPAVVPSCVRAGIDRPEQPLAAEPGQSYAGRPSYLVVMPHPGNPQRVDAYVVDSSCTTDSGTEPAEILVERTIPRD